MWCLRRFRYVRDLEREAEQHAEYVCGKATIEDLAIRNGALSLSVSTEMVHVMASQMACVLDGHNAENYVEIQMQHKDGRRFAVIVQRCEGKTPHEKRVEAEEELKRYLAAK
jgi:hypothetical protein